MVREAVLKEVKSIMDNGTFKIVDPTTQEKLPRKLRRLINKAIRCHFVFRAKPDKNGKLLKFKARLVANGNNQQEGVNYFPPMPQLPAPQRSKPKSHTDS